MNDEIKEILDKLKDREETYQFCKQYKLAINDWVYEAHFLLDYITNLQQELEEEKKIEEADLHKIQALEEENERLKETNVYCNRTDCVGRIKDSRKYDSVYQEKEDYKSRCEKINEILKESPDFNYSNDYIILKRKIESILQGEIR